MATTGGDGGGSGDVSAPTMERTERDDGGDDDPAKTRRPADVALKQQRMKGWQLLLEPKWVIAVYLAIGVVFIPTGVVLRRLSAGLIELKTVYESHLEGSGPDIAVTGCEIGENPNAMYLDGGRTCRLRMQVPFDKGDLEPPVLIHYELGECVIHAFEFDIPN